MGLIQCDLAKNVLTVNGDNLWVDALRQLILLINLLASALRNRRFDSSAIKLDCLSCSYRCSLESFQDLNSMLGIQSNDHWH